MRVYTSVSDGAIGLVAAQPAPDEIDEGVEPDLGALFERHHQRLYRLARRLVETPDEARDLVQDTFLRAARAPHAVPRVMPGEEAWLVRVLVNLCRDRWRKRVVQRRFTERHGCRETVATSPTCESALIAQTVVWRALRRLAPRRRAVIVLHELDGASVPDIAVLLGVTRGTIRWHLSLGRRELSRLIKNDERGKPVNEEQR